MSYFSEPILAFGALTHWNERGLCPMLKSIQRDPGGDFSNDSAPESKGYAGGWSGLE